MCVAPTLIKRTWINNRQWLATGSKLRKGICIAEYNLLKTKLSKCATEP